MRPSANPPNLLSRPVSEFPSDIHTSNVYSYRISSPDLVVQTYNSWNDYCVIERHNQVLEPGQHALSVREFHILLANMLVILAHGEPSLNNSYHMHIVVAVDGKNVVLAVSSLIQRIEPSPIAFLNHHADAVYQLGRRDAISFEFGLLNGLEPNYPGVGFVSFPFVSPDKSSNAERAAFRNMVRLNPLLQQYYFNNTMGYYSLS